MHRNDKSGVSDTDGPGHASPAQPSPKTGCQLFLKKRSRAEKTLSCTMKRPF